MAKPKSNSTSSDLLCPIDTELRNLNLLFTYYIEERIKDAADTTVRTEWEMLLNKIHDATKRDALFVSIERDRAAGKRIRKNDKRFRMIEKLLDDAVSKK